MCKAPRKGLLGRYKVALLGTQRSGKTATALRMVSDTFDIDYEPTATTGHLGVSCWAREQGVLLQVWDTAGQDNFENSCTFAAQNCDVVVIVYDVTDKESFDAINGMVAEVRAKRQDTPIVLLGNKIDEQERRVLEEDCEALAEGLDTYFAEASAKTGHGFENLEDLILEILWDPSFDPRSSKLPDLVLTLNAQVREAEEVFVQCINLAGNITAAVHVSLEEALGFLHPLLGELIDIPRRRLKLILPIGKMLQRVDAEKPVSSLLACH